MIGVAVVRRREQVDSTPKPHFPVRDQGRAGRLNAVEQQPPGPVLVRGLSPDQVIQRLGGPEPVTVGDRELLGDAAASIREVPDWYGIPEETGLLFVAALAWPDGAVVLAPEVLLGALPAGEPLAPDAVLDGEFRCAGVPDPRRDPPSEQVMAEARGELADFATLSSLDGAPGDYGWFAFGPED